MKTGKDVSRKKIKENGSDALSVPVSKRMGLVVFLLVLTAFDNGLGMRYDGFITVIPVEFPSDGFLLKKDIEVQQGWTHLRY